MPSGESLVVDDADKKDRLYDNVFEPPQCAAELPSSDEFAARLHPASDAPCNIDNTIGTTREDRAPH